MGGREGGKKKGRERERKQRTGKKHFTVSSYKFYKIEDGKVVRSRKTCPRCGPGTFLAAHKDRDCCGRCGYTVHARKHEAQPIPEAPKHETKVEQPKAPEAPKEAEKPTEK